MDLLSWSVDEVVRTSDEAAVRRRFDQRNLIYLFGLLMLFAVVAFLELVSQGHRNDELDVAIASANFILVAGMLLLVWDLYRFAKAGTKGYWRAARWMRHHLSATVITYILVQYALLLAFTRGGDNWVPWAMTMPMIVVGFRMLMAELILLHSMLLFGGLAMAAMTLHARVIPFVISIVVMNAIALSLELFFSYRMKKEVVAEWGERRIQAREQIRMRDELRYARELQLSMLPDCAPEVAWADLCAISVPATEVGGDYYDYFVDENRIALVCGDVAGHGMAAGLVLSAMRSGFTLLKDSLTNPASVLKRLHDLIVETSRRRMLVTVAVVLLDHAARRATIASAGHPPIVVAHADGTVEMLDLFAPPLGVRLPVDIPQRTIDLQAGDFFILHSDGIYETRNDRGDSYGLDRLMQVVRENLATDAEELRDAIVEDVERFRGSAPQEDDLTVVVAKIR